MVGRTGIIRPELPGASGSPPKHVLQFFALAGRGIFPARKLVTRSDKLPKGKEVRVFLAALDENCGVGMSKANASSYPNCVTSCESFICNHCTPPSDRFVSSIVLVGALGSHRSPSREHKVWHAVEDCAQRRSDNGAERENEQRDESLQSAYGEHVIESGAGQIMIGQMSSLLNRADAGMAKGGGRMHCELRFVFTSHAFQANPISRRPVEHVRGLKTCK